MADSESHSVFDKILLSLASIPVVVILFLILTIVSSLIFRVPFGLSPSTVLQNNTFIGITFAAFLLMNLIFGVILYFIWKGFWKAAFVFFVVFYIAAVVGFAVQFKSLRVLDVFYTGLMALPLVSVFSIGFKVKVFSRKIWAILFWICLVVFSLVVFLRFFPQFANFIPATLLGRLHAKGSNLLGLEFGKVTNLVFQIFFLYAIHKLGYGKKNVLK